VLKLNGCGEAPAGAGPGHGTLSVQEGVTSPPNHLSEAELIGLMERHGIGTDASISTHIENVLKRNYVILAPGRRLHPSPLGIVLAQGYMAIDQALVLPEVVPPCKRLVTHLGQPHRHHCRSEPRSSGSARG
jgi:DNA topoisomerase-3